MEIHQTQEEFLSGLDNHLETNQVEKVTIESDIINWVIAEDYIERVRAVLLKSRTTHISTNRDLRNPSWIVQNIWMGEIMKKYFNFSEKMKWKISDILSSANQEKWSSVEEITNKYIGENIAHFNKLFWKITQFKSSSDSEYDYAKAS